MYMHQVKRKSFYEELERVFNHFPQYHVKILLGNFNTKLEKRGFFKTTAGNESLHQDSNDNGVRIVNSATQRNLVVKSTMFPHRPLLMRRFTTRFITYC